MTAHLTGTRIHRATSPDGTRIAGEVHGEGPPLVLVHGGVGSEQSWRYLVPHLVHRFTCYPLSLRGRGRSEENPDHSGERLVEDVVAFAESIGGPVGLIGHSSGATLALVAAAQIERVDRLCLYEPALPELDDEMRDRYAAAFGRMRAAVEDGRPVDAAQIALEECALVNDEELAMLAAADAAGFVAPNVESHLREAGFATHRFVDDTMLGRVTMPVLLLRGTETHRFFRSGVDHLADLLPDARVRDVEGAGHMAPVLRAESVAAEIAEFLAPVRAAQL